MRRTGLGELTPADGIQCFPAFQDGQESVETCGALHPKVDFGYCGFWQYEAANELKRQMLDQPFQGGNIGRSNEYGARHEFERVQSAAKRHGGRLPMFRPHRVFQADSEAAYAQITLTTEHGSNIGTICRHIKHGREHR